MPTSIHNENQNRRISSRHLIILPACPCDVIRGTKGRQSEYSFFPGISDPFGVRTRACWQVISTARGMWSVCRKAPAFCNDKCLQDNFYVVTLHGCAVLLNKDTFEPNYSCVPIFIPCKLRYASWAVEGTVVTGNFRRAPDKLCSYFTSPTSTSTTSAPKGGPCASRDCCSSGTCASSSAQWCSPAISTRVLNASSPLVPPRASAAFPCSSQPSVRHVLPGPPWGHATVGIRR